jgi:hypothetical protein
MLQAKVSDKKGEKCSVDCGICLTEKGIGKRCMILQKRRNVLREPSESRLLGELKCGSADYCLSFILLVRNKKKRSHPALFSIFTNEENFFCPFSQESWKQGNFGIILQSETLGKLEAKHSLPDQQNQKLSEG